MVTESSVDVMVFAMDIIGYGPSQSYKLGSRRYREKKSVRYDQLQDLIESHAGLSREVTICSIEGDHVIESACK
jgi:hypothetical protein